MNTKEIQKYKEKLTLTQRQKDILVGLLLGDGHLETQNHGRTYRLKVEHGSDQREYLNWLSDEFSEWIHREPYEKVRKNGDVNYGFTTYSHGSLRFYGKQFYPEGKKVIPKLIYRFLTPLSLAIWYMDDGSIKSRRHKTYILHTLGYSKNDLIRVQKSFESKFGIKASLHRQKNRYWRLYISSESSEKFKQIINPHIIESMRYKLNNTLPKR